MIFEGDYLIFAIYLTEKIVADLWKFLNIAGIRIRIRARSLLCIRSLCFDVDGSIFIDHVLA